MQMSCGAVEQSARLCSWHSADMLFPSPHIIAFVLAWVPEHGQTAHGHSPVTLRRCSFSPPARTCLQTFRFTRKQINNASMSSDGHDDTGQHRRDGQFLQSVFALDWLSAVSLLSCLIFFLCFFSFLLPRQNIETSARRDEIQHPKHFLCCWRRASSSA